MILCAMSPSVLLCVPRDSLPLQCERGTELRRTSNSPHSPQHLHASIVSDHSVSEQARLHHYAAYAVRGIGTLALRARGSRLFPRVPRGAADCLQLAYGYRWSGVPHHTQTVFIFWAGARCRSVLPYSARGKRTRTVPVHSACSECRRFLIGAEVCLCRPLDHQRPKPYP